MSYMSSATAVEIAVEIAVVVVVVVEVCSIFLAYPVGLQGKHQRPDRSFHPRVLIFSLRPRS